MIVPAVLLALQNISATAGIIRIPANNLIAFIDLLLYRRWNLGANLIYLAISCKGIQQNAQIQSLEFPF